MSLYLNPYLCILLHIDRGPPQLFARTRAHTVGARSLPAWLPLGAVRYSRGRLAAVCLFVCLFAIWGGPGGVGREGPGRVPEQQHGLRTAIAKWDYPVQRGKTTHDVPRGMQPTQQASVGGA